MLTTIISLPDLNGGAATGDAIYAAFRGLDAFLASLHPGELAPTMLKSVNVGLSHRWAARPCRLMPSPSGEAWERASANVR
jgi:hypothetical protein